MTAEEVLSNDRSEIPSWLAKRPSLSAETLEQFLSSRVVYYPGSGEDDHAVELFGSTQAAHCFVYADYSESYGGPAPNVKSLLDPDNRRWGGCQLCSEPEVRSASDFLSLIKADSGHPWPGQDSRLTSARWAVLKRKPDSFESYCRQRLEADGVPAGPPFGILDPNDSATGHEPPLIAFLHISADAVWVYDKLWARRGKAPFAILLEETMTSWALFGGDQAPLYQLARGCNAFPKWLLVGDNTEAWPGYEEASEFTEPHRDTVHQRRLYRLTG